MSILSIVKRGACELCHGAVAALAGFSVSTVKSAIRQARLLGLIEVRERPVSRFRSDSNIITVISKAWLSWLRTRGQGVGFRKVLPTSTGLQDKSRQRAGESIQGAVLGGESDQSRQIGGHEVLRIGKIPENPMFCSGPTSGHGVLERRQRVIVVSADMLSHERIRGGGIEDHCQREL
ncbi:hypothetical protein [Methylobacterium brachiatum]|uniref:hypothetical protein n=1 Tax=Methylobacterium brachiatum TaxID=269660 RepID=UPI0013CF319B|nr:hypothetical protein [Methylobacterium brachiatum]